MSVFLLILKILGIVLLCIIGILLLFLLLILFVPVKYGRFFRYDGTVAYDISLSWLLRFLYIKAEDQAEKKEDQFRLFWFFQVPKGEGLLALLRKILNWLSPRAMYVIASLIEDESLQADPSTARAGKRLSESVRGILKAVLPKNLRGEAVYGLSSPDRTGYLTAFLATVMPQREHLRVTPDFTEACFSADLTFSAKIFIFKVVYYILRILLSKDIRRFLDNISEKYEREVQNGQ